MIEPGRLEIIVKRESPVFEEELRSFRELVNDSLRMTKLLEHLIEKDPSTKILTTMGRAFGDNLKTVEKRSEIDSDEAYRGLIELGFRGYT